MTDTTDSVTRALAKLDELRDAFWAEQDAAGEAGDVSDTFMVDAETFRSAYDNATYSLEWQAKEIARLNAQLATRAEVERIIASDDSRKLFAQFMLGLARQINETLEMIESDFRTAGARVVWGARGRDIMPQVAALMTVAELLAQDTPDFHDEARAVAAKRIEALADEIAARASAQITRAIERAARTEAAKFAEDGNDE